MAGGYAVERHLNEKMKFIVSVQEQPWQSNNPALTAFVTYTTISVRMKLWTRSPPAQVYVPSMVAYPSNLRSPEYGNDFVVRRIDTCGNMEWAGKNVYFSLLLSQEPIGLRQSSNDEWQVYYGPVVLGG